MTGRIPAPSDYETPKTKVRRIIVLMVRTKRRGEDVQLFTDAEAASVYCRALLRRSGVRRDLLGLSYRELVDIAREKFLAVETWERRLAV